MVASMVLIVSSGACEYRPLSTLGVEENRHCKSALSENYAQGRIEFAQPSQGEFTVTPTGDCIALRADRGQVRRMRFGRSRQEPDEATSHTGVPRLRGKVGNHWASLCRPTPEILKYILFLARFSL